MSASVVPSGVEDDIPILRAANAVLKVENNELRRENENLKERLSALLLELQGRAVDDYAAVGLRATIQEQKESLSPSINENSTAQSPAPTPSPPPPPPPPRGPPRHQLTRAQSERYSRHLLLPAFGVAAQQRLCSGSVLVVGCGGLGSPVALYLAAAGIGHLGLVDHDSVDVTNLHRQVLHTTGRVGMHKALSGSLACTALNPTIQVVPHTGGFTPATALPLVSKYDLVVDCSDNPATRYLVSDACVVAGKPLVSAAAVGTDGQLTVYNYGPDGPCYRCLFPESPAPENCSRCGEAGVLGVVPGVMGCLQALEVIKILSGVGEVSSKKLTIFDALSGRFTSVRLRTRSPLCPACGPSPALTAATLPHYDYVAFTGQPPDDGPPEELRLLDPSKRLSPQQVAKLLAAAAAAAEDSTNGGSDGGASLSASAPLAVPTATAESTATVVLNCGGLSEVTQEGTDSAGGRSGTTSTSNSVAAASATAASTLPTARRPLFLDVRPKTQYDVMALPGVVHIPFERLNERLGEVLALCGVVAAAGTAAVANHHSSGGGSGGGGGGGGGCSLSHSDQSREACVAPSIPPSEGTTPAYVKDELEGVNQQSLADDVSGAANPCRTDPPAQPCDVPRVVVLCRRGNNSQRVAALLAALGVDGVTDMRGGYQAWAREVDMNMPLL